MSSIYPNSIDGYSQLPLAVDTVTPINADTVNRLRSSIVNIETELGILPSSEAYADVAERLDALQALIDSLSAPIASTLGITTPSSDVAVVGNDNVFHYSWAAGAVRLIGLKVFSRTVATVGSYTLALVKDPGGASTNLLSAATFDMTSLVAYEVTDVSLTATAADLIFAENDVWEIEFLSDNVGLDAEGVYYQLVWQEV